uniref:Uncharacterized protein n=1 Tax=Physcomitrium patens TaxID=3218 RepID=A0A2K1KQS9_PHYPA|nr:hypothetical protein PHYPA_007025 [Physcomitrium patens]
MPLALITLHDLGLGYERLGLPMLLLSLIIRFSISNTTSLLYHASSHTLLSMPCLKIFHLKHHQSITTHFFMHSIYSFIDVELLEEYIFNYSLEDGSSVVKGRTIKIDETTLQKVLYLLIGELAVGAEVPNNIRLESYFKGRISSFERNQGWQTTDALISELMEWMHFIQKHLG